MRNDITRKKGDRQTQARHVLLEKALSQAGKQSNNPRLK